MNMHQYCGVHYLAQVLDERSIAIMDTVLLKEASVADT